MILALPDDGRAFANTEHSSGRGEKMHPIGFVKKHPLGFLVSMGVGYVVLPWGLSMLKNATGVGVSLPSFGGNGG